MFAMSAVVLVMWWSSPSLGVIGLDEPEDQAVTQQEEPPPPGLEADQKLKHGPRDEPASSEGRGERRWDRMRHQRWQEFREHRGAAPSPEMIDLAMGVLQEKLPHYFQEMTKLRTEDKARFDRAIGMIMPVVMEYLELKDRDQKLADTIIEEFKIEHQLRKLSHEFKAAEGSPEKQATCEQEIRKLVRRQFELRIERQEARLKEFAERLERQREELDRERKSLEQRQSKLDDLVAERVEEVKSGKMGDRFHPRGPRHGGMGEPGGPPRGFRGEGPHAGQHEAQPPADGPRGDRGGPGRPDRDQESGARPHPPAEPPPPKPEGESEE